MKKTVAFVVLTAILLSACSCKNTESPPSESESDSVTTSTVTSGTTTEAVPDTESEQSDPGDTTESNIETSADDTEPVETTPPSSEPIVSSSPVTDPPATDPPVTDPPITNVPDPSPSLLFKDPYFKKGVNYSRLDVAVKKGRLSYSTGSPTWLYSQEMSKYDISQGTYTSPEDGVHIYEDTSKYLLLNTNTGFFRMGIKGSEEYTAPRTAYQRFTGALMTPSVTEKVFVKDLSHLYVTLDFTLDEVTRRMTDEEFDRGLHTAQWNYYVFVQDSRSSSWFYVGLPLYDYRGTGESEYITGDPGTGGTLIYIPTAKAAYGENETAVVGTRFTKTVDLLPFIERGFARGQVKGFLKNRNLDTFYISGCNLGWEIPGTFDCMASVYEFSMSYELK